MIALENPVQDASFEPLPDGSAPSTPLLELARGAAQTAAAEAELGPDLVGDAVGGSVEDATAYTVRFRANVQGYRGWEWSVTAGIIDPSRPTVSEVVLLPGPDALLAPEWVPWEERIRSDDLRAGDVLPASPDDPRLVPAYRQSDDPAVEALAQEMGLGRVRVMSRFGRQDAADRWHGGAFGPNGEMAKAAPGNCITCAFYLPLAGSLGGGFGVCGNQYSPADGRVVDMAFGCGAHSEATVKRSRDAITDVVIDELALEVHQRTLEAVNAADDDDDEQIAGDDTAVTTAETAAE